jgi:hypothetical protein
MCSICSLLKSALLVRLASSDRPALIVDVHLLYASDLSIGRLKRQVGHIANESQLFHEI